MRTEQDLRAALSAREDLTPEVDSVLVGAREAATGQRRRRTIAAVAATAAVVAAVVTVPVVLASGPSPKPGPELWPAAPQASPPLVPFDPSDPRPRFAFTVYPTTVAGYQIQPFAVAPDYQLAYVTRLGAVEPAAVIAVYQPDARAHVGGFFEDPEAGPEDPPSSAPTYRWEYIPGAEAEMTIDFGPALDQQTVEAVAGGLRFTAPYPARLPFRLDYLPDGATLIGVGQFTGRPGAYRSWLEFDGALTAIDIAVSEDPVGEHPEWDWQPTTFAGRPAQCVDLSDGNRCVVEIDGLAVDIGFSQAEADEAARIIAGLHAATWENPATWYEIDEALP